MEKVFARIFIIIILFLFSEAFSQEVKIKGVNYQRYEGERLVWKLLSDSYEQKGDTFIAKKVYLENLPKGLRIYADEAFYLKAEEKFILKGNVKILTEKEGEIYTEELIFYPKRNLLLAQGEVTIVKENLKLSGSGLTYDLAKGDLKLQKRAKAQFKF